MIRRATAIGVLMRSVTVSFTVTPVAIPISADPMYGEPQLVEDRYERTVTTEGAYNEYQLLVDEPGVTLVNQNPEVATLTGSRTTRQTDGTCVVSAKKQGTRRDVSLNHTSTSANYTEVVVNHEGENPSLRHAMHVAVEHKLVGTPDSPNAPYTWHRNISYYLPGTTPNLARNTECWAADIDFAWLSVHKTNTANNSGSRASLVAPDIALVSKHYQQPSAFPGTWYWVSAEGIVFQSQVSEFITNADLGDIMVIKLETSAPEEIGFVQVVGPGWSNKFGSQQANYINVLTFLQGRKAVPVVCAGFNGIHGKRSDGWKGMGLDGNGDWFIAGDSSSPSCFVLYNTPILKGLVKTPTIDEAIWSPGGINRVSAINAAMTDLDSPYQLTEYSFTAALVTNTDAAGLYRQINSDMWLHVDATDEDYYRLERQQLLGNPSVKWWSLIHYTSIDSTQISTSSDAPDNPWDATGWSGDPAPVVTEDSLFPTY